MDSNSSISKEVLERLSGKWSLTIITHILFFLVTMISGPVSIIVVGPLAVGLAKFNLSLMRGEEAKTEQIFEGFKNFGNAFGVYILTLIIVCIGMILFIVPGIIAALALSQTFYILSENPDKGIVETLRQSRDMMEGHKMQLFFLYIKFMLLSFLCLFTLGIGFIWLLPYMQANLAAFHEALEPVSQEQFV
jgi:uncharacterized membrane protein